MGVVEKYHSDRKALSDQIASDVRRKASKSRSDWTADFTANWSDQRNVILVDYHITRSFESMFL